ncbi:hypothetical protein AAEX37_01494 [Oligella sp. MSHR50489EDL]|uniref:Wadjet anti-phage system protein JetD domain-containing protein n=1 Tax=Oligella sp. MSHR50489EDL TaxID=3139409 RepID=UPI003D81930C
MTTKPGWGLLPEDAKKIWRQRYFNQSRNYRQLLGGDLDFPVSLSLKSPASGNAILDNLEHFRIYVEQWRRFAAKASATTECEIIWKQQSYQRLSSQQVPTQLIASNADALVHFIGGEVLQQWRKINALLEYLIVGINCSDSFALRKVLITHLSTLEQMSSAQLDLLLRLIPQLRANLGAACYLRALPVIGVDTKFIEQYSFLIEDMLSIVQDARVKELGLLNWLGCTVKPKDWLLVRPLCERQRAKFANIDILRLSTETLMNYPLTAKNILIIENEQSCLGLNQLADTIAVAGGGKNLAWLAADCLSDKRVAYWGDIDSEGFAMLSKARQKLPHLTALMMSEREVLRFEDRMVAEPDSVFKEPEYLSGEELKLFLDLRADVYRGRRLEQERLDRDYIEEMVQAWVEGKI